jgi:hypothetical protein
MDGTAQIGIRPAGGARPTFRRRPDATVALLAVTLGLILMGPYGVLGAPAREMLGTPQAVHSSPSAPAFAPPPFGLGHLRTASVRPSESPEFYTQIGSTFSEVNGSSSIAGMPTISEQIRVVSSPYPTAYELNGVSNTGDWYQIVVADNWPGCPSKFVEGTEIWDNQDNSQPMVCSTAVSLSKGDIVQLVLTVKSSSQVCLDLTDLSTRATNPLCESQPDHGATEFQFMKGPSDNNGYYTGTMTEVVNTTATSCPDDSLLPTVTFDLPPWANITGYVGWSDERDISSAGTFCYSSSTSVDTLLPGDISSHYTDSTGSSQYGPHYIEAQNDSFLNSSVSFRFQSDPVPLYATSVNASTLTPTLGQSVSLHATAQGGVPPYGSTIWQLNGSLRSPAGPWWNWTVNGSGNYTIEAFVVDRQGDVSPASAPVVLEVPFALWVGAIQPGGRSSVDVGQPVHLSAQAGGGTGWRQYSWSGLPDGCTSRNESTLACTPTEAGEFPVVVTVEDANGVVRASPALQLHVSTDPVVTVHGEHTVADVGQTATFQAIVVGGSGGDRYTWEDLPPACRSSNATAVCAVTAEGSYDVSAVVTDSNGYAAQSTVVVLSAYLLPNVTVRADRPIADQGANVSVTLSAFVTGGAGGYSFQWAGLPAGCAGSDLASILCAPLSTGTSRVTVSVVDQANGTATSAPYTVVVVPPLRVSLVPTADSVVAPGNVSFIATLSGGSQVSMESWNVPPAGCQAETPQVLNCTGLPAGSYIITYTVVDVGGSIVTALAHVMVQPPPAHLSPSNPLLGGISTIDLEILGVLVVIAVAAAIGLRGLRKS